MFGPELGNEPTQTQDFTDRDGVDPERRRLGLGRRKLHSQPLPQIKTVFFPELHPDEVSGSVKKKRQEKEKRIQSIHAS